MTSSISSGGNADDARAYSHPGVELGTQGTPATSSGYLPNYLAPAVIVTFICCMPVGAVALIYAARVNGKQIAGQWEEARKSSESARLWCWIALGVGIVFWTFYILLIIIVMVLSSKGL
jgi:hypothetical protein